MMELWTRLQFGGLVFLYDFVCVCVQEAPAPCVESMKPEEMQELLCRGPNESYSQGGVVKHEGSIVSGAQVFSYVFIGYLKNMRSQPRLCSLQDRKVAAMLLRSARTKAGSCPDHSILRFLQGTEEHAQS